MSEWQILNSILAVFISLASFFKMFFKSLNTYLPKIESELLVLSDIQGKTALTIATANKVVPAVIKAILTLFTLGLGALEDCCAVGNCAVVELKEAD